MHNSKKNIKSTKILLQLLIATGVVFVALSCTRENTIGREVPYKKEKWHNISRSIRYSPDGEDFVIVNGARRFNRALYGSNTAFRVEAGDLPEFALYLPGMGGNFQFGLMAEDKQKWLIEAGEITARYRAGSMHYEIKDPMLGSGKLLISVLPMFDCEGMLIRASLQGTGDEVELFWVYGGVTGKKFSRGGDIGADPESSFYLKLENCKDNTITLAPDNTFTLSYGKSAKTLAGTFPETAEVKVATARSLDSPSAVWESGKAGYPVIAGKVTQGESYFAVYNPESRDKVHYGEIKSLFEQAEEDRKAIAGRITVRTPDPYINTLGGALAMAADAIWEHPSYLHGAVAWRMPLPGWRGAYSGDWLGWHERARTHFASYGLSQYTEPAAGPVLADPETNLARQKEEKGTALFTSGYISRRPGGISKPHHYDMNQVFMDQLFRHFNWSGDTAFLREMWPVIQRHLAWETRNFDQDGDGLYSAYASIWASDALQYNGGGVAYSSAYNYLAYKSAARLADLIGKDPAPYKKESERILSALNDILWMPEKGRYAEFKDLLGGRLLHPYPGLWSVYHLVDSKVPDTFQSYQMLRYVDREIPHIPIIAKGMPEGDYYTLSTTNWMPYTWSVNNVALAEVLHTSLAYWQSGSPEKAFQLWKSALLESMYLGASPGNFQQLSFYDAMRGELYRDNGGPVGMASRTLVEGLFGVMPDLINQTLKIKPGFPASWKYASLSTPDVSVDFTQTGDTDTYTIAGGSKLKKVRDLILQVRAARADITSVKVDGREVQWELLPNAVDYPQVQIMAPVAGQTKIEITWGGDSLEVARNEAFIAREDTLEVTFGQAELLEIYDPQKAITLQRENGSQLKSTAGAGKGHKTIFVKLSQGQMSWWEPVVFEVVEPVMIISGPSSGKDTLSFALKNNTAGEVSGKVTINPGNGAISLPVSLGAGQTSSYHIPGPQGLLFGNNVVQVEWPDGKTAKKVAAWNIHPVEANWETTDISAHFNDRVTNIFKNEYSFPRSPYPTLQIPLHGLGDWCSYKAFMEIDDTGLRRLSGEDNTFTLPQGIPFSTPGAVERNNIVFTSLWDNYPGEVLIPLSGKATHAYFLMAGTTNPMQSRIENGLIRITYTDGSSDSLSLVNPQTWWPLEQDYYTDGYAFRIDGAAPVRVHLKTGWMGREFEDYVSIGNFTKYAIDGGAATVLDIPLDARKTLKQLSLKTTANDVVIGLMSVTLAREPIRENL